MARVKKRIFSGVVCEQVVYTVSDRAKNPKKSKPRERFKDEAERAEHRRQIARRHNARMINANYTPAGYFVTLTMNRENECHDWDEARKIRTNYVRRLQRACPDCKINLYMGRGKSTSRIHFHMICEGIPEEIIAAKWTEGEVKAISHLREHNVYNGVDHGADFTSVANYCFDHWTEDQGGKRYYQNRNVRQPDEEEATICVRSYSPERPPVPPKGYIYTGCVYNQYGYMCFHYVIKPAEKRKYRKRERRA